MVWDTIYARDVGREEPTEEWGGIAYALSAFEAAAPDDWTLFPILKVGADLRERASRFLGSLDRIESMDGVRTVPEPNNRVELRYMDDSRRCERLTGGVPGWTAEELWPLARSCDAVYVNFIAGWELDIAAARALGEAVDGPLYVDLHSLLLGIGPDGVRVLRPLARWREWLACFDVVQLNEEELRTLVGARGDPWELAATAIGSHTKALLVTIGERGAAWVASLEFWREGLRSIRPSHGVERVGGAVASGRIETACRVEAADPTGCGDVWGIACFSSLLAGHDLERSIRRANELAARNAALRGASGLAKALRSDAALFEEAEQG